MPWCHDPPRRSPKSDATRATRGSTGQPEGTLTASPRGSLTHPASPPTSRAMGRLAANRLKLRAPTRTLSVTARPETRCEMRDTRPPPRPAAGTAAPQYSPRADAALWGTRPACRGVGSAQMRDRPLRPSAPPPGIKEQGAGITERGTSRPDAKWAGGRKSEIPNPKWAGGRKFEIRNRSAGGAYSSHASHSSFLRIRARLSSR
jgi:hypothetical protein